MATISAVVWTTMVVVSLQFILPTNQTEHSGKDNKFCTDTSCYQSSQSKKFFAQFGRNINVTKLVYEYALICPLYDTCGEDLDRSFVYNGEHLVEFEDCTECTCEWSCQFHKTCCPGCTYGYLEHDCYDANQDVEGVLERQTRFPAIGRCMNRQIEMNSTLTDLCVSGELQPCKTKTSLYKNTHCAICNGDNEICKEILLQTECLRTTASHLPLMHYTSLSDYMTQHNCHVVHGDKDVPNCKPVHRGSIDTCNITGLWTKYDADIEWGCRNFQTPHGEFKNVFCYICNPSKTNSVAQMSVTQCVNEYGDILRTGQLSKKCANLPSTRRLYPYKNVYCLACKPFRIIPMNRTHVTLVKVINETFNATSLKSEIDVQFQIKSQGVDTLSELFDKYFINLPPRPDNELIQFNTLDDFYVEHVDEIMNEYKSLCGYSTMCQDFSFGSRRMNIACEDLLCSCDSSCASNDNCCPYFLFTNHVFSSLKCGYALLNGNVSNMNEDSQGLAPCPKSDIFIDASIIIAKCLSHNITDFLRQKCESMEYDLDYLKYIPIRMAKGVYRNIYCLQCNHVHGLPLQEIRLRLQCQSYLESRLNHDLNDFMNYIYDNCDGYSYSPDPYEVPFSKSYIDYAYSTMYVLPDEKVSNGYSAGSLIYFDRCNITGKWSHKNAVIEKTCADTSPSISVMKTYKIRNYIYKNFACVICNEALFDTASDKVISDCITTDQHYQILCNDTAIQPVWRPYKNMYCAWCNQKEFIPIIIEFNEKYLLRPKYKYMFSFTKSSFNGLLPTDKKPVPTCIDGFYDVILGKCQIWICYKGFTLQNNICRPSMMLGINQRFLTEFVVEYISTEEPDAEITFVHLDDLSESISNEISSRLDINTIFLISFLEFRTDNEINCVQITGKQHKSINVTKQSKIHVFIDLLIAFSLDISSETIHLEQMTKTGSFLIKTNGSAQTLFSVDRDVAWTFQKSTPLNMCEKIYMSSNGLDSETQISPIKEVTHILDEFLFCPMVRFSDTDVVSELHVKDIKIKTTGWKFKPYMYRIKYKSVYICDRYVLKYIQPSKIMHDPLEDALNNATLGCTILSITCLLLTFSTYSLFPKLRKRDTGKSNMVLCLVLSLAQASLQFGLEKNDIKILCILIGVVIHFLLVCSFCTMNVCAFNMFKVFYINRNSRNDSVRFKKYMLYITFVPSCLVATVIGVNLIGSNWSDVGYGRTYCFISDFHQMLCLFYIPCILIFVANACFFFLAFYAIRSSPSMCGKQDRRDFFTYVKLSSIVGLTWPLLMIDNFIGLTWFSFVSSCLNALQGVFIFFSLIVNRTVKQLYMNHFKLPVRSSPTPSPT